MRLEEALTGARLTVVIAPAGFGKTTLLSAWGALNAKRVSRMAWLPRLCTTSFAHHGR
jgi:ATP/maltotriose-dependent transcriptional regulator MalT